MSCPVEATARIGRHGSVGSSDQDLFGTIEFDDELSLKRNSSRLRSYSSSEDMCLLRLLRKTVVHVKNQQRRGSRSQKSVPGESTRSQAKRHKTSRQLLETTEKILGARKIGEGATRRCTGEHCTTIGKSRSSFRNRSRTEDESIPASGVSRLDMQHQSQ